jgi:hypothetical protein
MSSWEKRLAVRGNEEGYEQQRGKSKELEEGYK